MVDPEKIALMTKFAIYEKRYGKRDKKINSYFLNDYVYYKNSWTRFSVLLGCVIVLFFYWTHQVVVEGIDLFAIDFRVALIQNLIFIGTVMFVYTLVSTKRAVSAYHDAMQRLKNYFILLNKLDE